MAVSTIPMKFTIGRTSIEYEIMDPQKERATYEKRLAEFWNRLLSVNPDRLDNNKDSFVYLRTSTDYLSEGPLMRDMEIYEDQWIFCPIITSEIDEYDMNALHLNYKTSNGRLAVALADQREANAFKRIGLIENTPIVDSKDLHQYLIAVPQFSLTVAKLSPLRRNLEVPYLVLPKGPLDASVAGHCIILRLSARKTPYTITLYAEGVRDYETGARYRIKVKARKATGSKRARK